MDTLKELFPHINDHELQQYLNSAANDLDLCVSMILSDNDNLSNNNNTNTNASVMGEEQIFTSPNPLEELNLMFPKLHPTVIESTFRDENGKISNVIAQLLNLEYINSEISRENSDLPTLIDDQNTFKQRGTKKRQWRDTYDDIGILTNLLNWTNNQSLLTQLYHENQFSTIKTLIFIILKQIHPSSLPPQTSSTSNSTLKGKRFSRVQNNTGFAHNKNISRDKDKDKNKYIEGNVSALPTNRDFNNNKYKHENENESENIYISYEEYLSLIKQHKHCDGINPQFILNLFKYFQSNESKTDIQYCYKVLQYILDDPNNIVLTFNKYNNETSWNSVSNKSKKSTTTTIATASTNTRNNNIHHSVEVESTYKDSKIDSVFETYKLDFHGFAPKEAIVVLNNIMNKWWAEELKLRELNNYNLKQQKVTCLEPLILITGRGIHSIGGRSPVRFQVKRYLQLNGYLFYEEPSYFKVYGKQRKEYMKK